MTLLLNYLTIGAVLTLILNIAGDYADDEPGEANVTLTLWLLWLPAVLLAFLLLVLLFTWWACETISDRIHRRRT